MENLKQAALRAEPRQERIAAPPVERPSGRANRLLLFAVVIIAAAAAVFFAFRLGAPNHASASQPIPSVAAERVVRQDVYSDVPIPAEFRPYVEADLHAMVTGYVDQMNVDFGDRVKQGEVLATIEVPELYDRLHNAMATQQQAQADYVNEHLIYTRLLQVVREQPKLVAQQDIDTAQSKDASAAAALAAAKANVEKYQTLVNYTKIVAPFDGVITKRSADPGDLVQAGTGSGNPMPMLRVSDNYLLRLDFPVSDEYVKDVHVGDPVTVRVDSLAGKFFTGKITRCTNDVNLETRTMMTETEVKNPDLEIIPGMYAVVLFKFAQQPGALTIPAEAVNDPKDPVVYVINGNNEIEARQVKLGIEMPEKWQVTQGLKEGELVMLGDRSKVHPGEKVEPKLVSTPTIPGPPSL